MCYDVHTHTHTHTLAMSGETKRDSKTRHGGRSRCWQRHQALAMGWIVGLGLETPFVLRMIEDAVFSFKKALSQVHPQKNGM